MEEHYVRGRGAGGEEGRGTETERQQRTTFIMWTVGETGRRRANHQGATERERERRVGDECILMTAGTDGRPAASLSSPPRDTSDLPTPPRGPRRAPNHGISSSSGTGTSASLLKVFESGLNLCTGTDAESQ